MTAMHNDPNEQTFDIEAERRHAITVACPQKPHGCGQPVGHLCLGPHGKPTQGVGCWRRVAAADLAHPEGAHPAVPPEPEPVPRPRRLVAAAAVRTDMAAYRQPCSWCHAPVVRALNRAGHVVPVDAEPAKRGRLVLEVDERGPRCSGLLVGRALRSAQAHGTPMYVPHRDTCPYGTRWSRHARR